MCPYRPVVLCVHGQCTVLVVSLPQRGDSAVIMATVGHQSDVLRLLVEAGADLNLQNEVRSGTVDTTSCIIPVCPC